MTSEATMSQGRKTNHLGSMAWVTACQNEVATASLDLHYCAKWILRHYGLQYMCKRCRQGSMASDTATCKWNAININNKNISNINEVATASLDLHYCAKWILRHYGLQYMCKRCRQGSMASDTATCKLNAININIYISCPQQLNYCKHI